MVTEFNSGRYQYGLTGVDSKGKGVKVGMEENQTATIHLKKTV